jgi:hypothetical protein
VEHHHDTEQKIAPQVSLFLTLSFLEWRYCLISGAYRFSSSLKYKDEFIVPERINKCCATLGVLIP